MNTEHANPPSQPEDDAVAQLSGRLELVHDTIDTTISRLRAQIARHYAWRDRLDEDRKTIETPEEKTTQKEIIAVVENRIRRFEHQIQTCRHDLALLRKHGSEAVLNARANTGDLVRILEKYEASPDYDPTGKPRLQGQESLPDFMRQGSTSGIARTARLTRFETFAFRGKVVVKAAVVLMLLLVAANALNGPMGDQTTGGAKFARPGSGTGFTHTVTGALDGAFGGTTQPLSKVLAMLTGTDVSRLAEDTAGAMADMETGPALDRNLPK